MTSKSNDETLSYLVDLLDLVVREQVGESLANRMQTIRRLATERRTGLPDAEARLVAELKRLQPTELRSVIRWLSLFFDLANAAEERVRIEVLEQRDRHVAEHRLAMSAGAVQSLSCHPMTHGR